jgi:hypothetical protein
MRRRLLVALVAVIALGGVGRAQRGRAPGSAPQGVGGTIKAASAALGLARGLEGGDWLISAQYEGNGSMMVQGQTVKLPRYRASIRFDVKGMRVDYDLGEGAQTKRHVEVVTGNLAWDEDKPGGGLVANYGTATQAPGTQAERLLQIWMTPLGVIKAATKPGKWMVLEPTPNTKLSEAGGREVLTFPLAAPLENVTMTVTLDAQHRPQHVEARMAGKVFEATYSDYKDWDLSDTYQPAHIVNKRDGQTVLDLTVTKGWGYNPYVIFPIPQSVKTAADKR